MSFYVFYVGLLALAVVMLVSLVRAAYFLLRDPPGSSRLFYTLTTRIAAAVLFFMMLWVACACGWVQPHGLGSKPVHQHEQQ